MTKEQFTRIVSSFISRHRLLQTDGQYLVALSGGADSVALLLVLKSMGYEVEAVHCNFHLRGEESDRDEQFVVSLCERHGVKLHRIHFDTRAYAQLHHVSIEMAARELRYRYFEQLRQDLGMNAVCVAHHRDDVVETVLMNLMRGTGLRGLQGIRPQNGNIVRPLLSVWRKDIEDYLSACHETFVTDSTNAQDDYVRNSIRLHVVPLLNSIQPAASNNIFETTQHVADALTVYDEGIARQRMEAVTEDADGRLTIDLSAVRSESLLFEVLKEKGFTNIQDYRDMVAGGTGKLFSSDSHDMVMDRGRLIVEPKKEAVKPLVVPEAGTYRLSDGERLTFDVFERTTGFVPSKDAACAHVDASQVRFPLTVRRVQEGDRFVPFGMNGHRLVSDLLTDQKVNVLDKRKSLVVCDATGDIVWLVGYRTGQRFRVTGETTTILSIHRQ